MAKFTAPVDLNIRLPGGEEAIGSAGTTHRISDALVEEFIRDVVPNIPGGVTWITQDETSAIPSLPIAESDVANLTSDLAAKAATVHTHAESQVTNLQTDLGYLTAAVVSAKAYGVVADGVTDDSSALAAAIASLPSSHGTLILPSGTIAYGTPLDLSGKKSIVIRGQGGFTTVGNSGTILKYTGTGSQAVNMQSTFGVWLEDLSVLASNAAFTGRVVDIRNVGSVDPAYSGVRRCIIGGTGGANSAAVGIDLDKATRIGIYDTLVQATQVGIRGKSVDGNYSNQVLIQNVSFRDNVLANIRNAGEAWTIISCEGNPLSSGAAGFYDHDTSVFAKALTIQGSWMGDVTNGGTQIKAAGDGIAIIGNLIGGNASATGVNIDQLSNGIVVTANRFSTHSIGIDWGSAAHTGKSSRANAFSSVTTRETPKPKRLWLSAEHAKLDSGTANSLSTAPDIVPTVDLADAATQGAYWLAAVPNDYEGSPLGLIVVWAPRANDATPHSVQWSVDVLARHSGQSTGSGGTTTTWTGDSAARTAPTIVYETEQSLGVSPVAGDLIRFDLRRVGADAADTYVGTVALLGVFLTY